MPILTWFRRLLAMLLAFFAQKPRKEFVPLQREPEIKPAVRVSRVEVEGPIKESHLRRVIRLRGARRFRCASEAGRAFGRTFRTGNRLARELRVDELQLERHGLPLWRSEEELAEGLGVGRKELRFFSQHRLADRFCHYVQFTIPKRRGGVRTIMAPRRRLKALQRDVLRKLVDLLPVSDCSHGFRKGRSIASGAALHVGKEIVISMDLADFFPSITFARVRGYLLAMGYGYDVAATLAALMTESVRQAVVLHDETRFVPVSDRHCVQGAPTSPGLCNAIARRMDRRLSGLAAHFGFVYTRYADDLTFSGADCGRVGLFCAKVRQIVRAEGFVVNEAKTRVARSGGRQRVTGVTVNREMGLSKRERRKLRAMIHHHVRAKQSGEFDSARERLIEGKLAYLSMLNPSQASALRRRLQSGIPAHDPKKKAR